MIILSDRVFLAEEVAVGALTEIIILNNDILLAEESFSAAALLMIAG